jgi:hypothetical protein
MSATYHCQDCHRPIPSGQAVIRSISLQRVAFHKDCAELRGIRLATEVVSAASARLAS